MHDWRYIAMYLTSIFFKKHQVLNIDLDNRIQIVT
jgi:hypothetical protein